MKEDFNKIIESLNIEFRNIQKVSLQEAVAVSIKAPKDAEIIIASKDVAIYGKHIDPISKGGVLLIPAGSEEDLSFIKKNTNHSQTLQSLLKQGAEKDGDNIFYIMEISTKIFTAINFFPSVELPPFSVTATQNILSAVEALYQEDTSVKTGKERLIKIYSEEILIKILRYIIDQGKFVENLLTNITYFKDPRLLDVIEYIKDNIEHSLSNKVLADVVNVSEDYVGQYFKMLTGITPQDFIEYQRMSAALKLLRTTKKSIRDVSKAVGFKDTAYFCRRFKMMYGVSAGKMRRKHSAQEEEVK